MTALEFTTGVYVAEEVHLPDVASLIELHLDEFTTEPSRSFLKKSLITKGLADVAHYMSLREQLVPDLHFDAVVGITHRRLAAIATRHFGFNAMTMPTEAVDEETSLFFSNIWDSDPMKVSMLRDQFMSRYLVGEPSDRVSVQATVNSFIATHRYTSVEQAQEDFTAYLEEFLPSLAQLLAMRVRLDAISGKPVYEVARASR